MFTLAIDGRTKLPASITSPAYDPVLGDVAIETSFDGYQDAGGLKLPTRIAARRDRDVVAALEVSRNVVAATMLMVYVPHARIPIAADLFDRSSTGKFPLAANLVDNVRRRGLDVERLVGLHGRPVPFAEVIAAAVQQP